LTISHPRVRRILRDGFIDLLTDADWLPVTIAGTATAGIPHAAWLAEAVEAPMVYARSSAKGHGTGARIEGRLQKGDEVVVLEDLISTGGSALEAVDALREAGARVRGVLAIFTYQLQAAETGFRDADVEARVLTDFQTLIDVAHAEDRLSDEELRTLEEWQADPGTWSVEHGGDRPK
jgi:orotate phosphoribosyltransferase